jgi:hypothetical protein
MTDNELLAEITRVRDALDKCRADFTATQHAFVDHMDSWSPSALEVTHEHLGTLIGRLGDLYRELEPLEAEFRRRDPDVPVPPEVKAKARKAALTAAIEEAERAKEQAERFGVADPQWQAAMDAFLEKLRQELRDLDDG